MEIGQFRELLAQYQTGYIQLKDGELSVAASDRVVSTTAPDPAQNRLVRTSLYEALSRDPSHVKSYVDGLRKRLLETHADEVLTLEELKGFLDEYDGQAVPDRASVDALVLDEKDWEMGPADLAQLDKTAARTAVDVFKVNRLNTLLQSVQMMALEREECEQIARRAEQRLTQFYALKQGDLKDPSRQVEIARQVAEVRDALMDLAETLRAALNRSEQQPEGLLNLMSYCYARATEVQSVYQAAAGSKAEDDSVPVSELMAQAALEMHGADAFRTAVGGKVETLVAKLEELKQKPDTELQGRSEIAALRAEVAHLESQLERVKTYGIRAGSGSADGVFRPDASLVEGYLETVRRVKGDLDTYRTADYSKLARDLVDEFFPAVDPDLSSIPELKAEIRVANHVRTRLLDALSQGLKNFKEDVFDAIATEIKSVTTDELHLNALDPTIVGIAKRQLIAMREVVRGEVKIEPSVLLKFMSGQVGLGTLVAARAHGFGPELVDERIDDRFLKGSEELGQGGVNTVQLVTYGYSDGTTSVRVFKPETNARMGLSRLNLGHSGYDDTTRVAHLNQATARAASFLGIPQVADPVTVGVHEGKIGFFMRQAPGLTARKLFALRRANASNAKLGTLSMRSFSGLALKDFYVKIAPLQKGLCALQWLDWLTGQTDRHSDNYCVDVRPGGEMGVKAIDNDGSFSGYRVGLYKYRLKGVHLQRALRALHKRDVAELLSSGLNYVQQLPDKSVVIDVENRPQLMRKISVNVFGCNSASRPSVIPEAVYQKLMALDVARGSDPQALRKAAEGLFSPGAATEDQLTATEARLAEMIDYAKRLKTREDALIAQGKADRLILADADWATQAGNLIMRQRENYYRLTEAVRKRAGKITADEQADVFYFGQDYLYRDFLYFFPTAALLPKAPVAP